MVVLVLLGVSKSHRIDWRGLRPVHSATLETHGDAVSACASSAILKETHSP